MKKTIITTVLAALMATLPALADAPEGYYNSAIGRSDEALMTALTNIIRPHTQLSYDQIWDKFKSTDTDAQGYIIDMYSNYRYRPSDHGSSASYIGSGYNREHSFPKSWFNQNYPMYTDLHHLYPTDVCVNNQRSNYPFGVCANGTRKTTGSYYGKGKLGTSTYPGYNGVVFEPDDEYKGDFARTYFYMVTCYKNELSSWSGSAQLNYSANGYKAFSTWSINMLMEWTRMDPVSPKEIKRNHAVDSIQGNRNPFIDYPELAEYIWGNLQGKGWPGPGGGTTPAITSPENGVTYDMGSTTTGTGLSYQINVKGRALTSELVLSMTDNDHFEVNKDTFTAAEANSGATLTITFTSQTEGAYNNTITIGSDEASTTFMIKATVKSQGEGPTPPSVVGDSIMEDWEGCTTGGYWSKQVTGHTWTWNFTDAGIWGDNLRHGELSCRLGKSSSSAIAMAEDVEGGTSAIAFWAASYGSDGDANLQVEYSTDKGSTWNVLGDFTVTRGTLQHIIMDIPLEGNARFSIVQRSGMRVNIDDITVYGRVQEQELAGDVNGDGEVSVADINMLVNLVLGGSADEATMKRADVNNDREISVADINTLVELVLKS